MTVGAAFWRLALLAGVVGLLEACAGPASNTAVIFPHEEVLEVGGALQAERPQPAIRVDGEWVTCWGITEVPEGSRLQMAFAGLDAIARSELLKLVRVRVQSVVEDRAFSDPASRSIVATTVERVAGVVDGAGSLPHGWARIRRGDEVVLRLWARLRVRREVLAAALDAALKDIDASAEELVAGLGQASGPAQEADP